MNIIEPVLLAFSLSLDCFAISISQGLRKSTDKKSLTVLAFLFGIFQAGMFILGYYTGNFVFKYLNSIANWIAVLLLLFIGGKMIKEGLNTDDEEVEELTNVKEYLFLSIATSIDAFAAGISFTSIKASFPVTSIIVGLISLIMALIGGFSGNKIGEKIGKRSEIFGGLVLIGLAIKTFFQG